MARLGSVWVLADDRPGNASQCLGVADALGVPYTVKNISYGVLGTLPNALLGASFVGLDAASRAALLPPWPDIVIAAGRRCAPVARRIKRLAGGATFLVQIMDPGPVGREEIDLIAVPRHDEGPEGANILTVLAAPHRLNAARLSAAAEAWRERFATLPMPHIGLLVGGSTRRRSLSPVVAGDLGSQCAEMARAAGGSLLVTTSRRTGTAAEAALMSAIDCPAYVHCWSGGGEGNPYEGILGLATGLVVTGDSVSMCSEATAVDGALYIAALPGLITAKHARFHANLISGGYARPFEGAFEAWSHPRLDVAEEISRAVERRLAARAES